MKLNRGDDKFNGCTVVSNNIDGRNDKNSDNKDSGDENSNLLTVKTRIAPKVSNRVEIEKGDDSSVKMNRGDDGRDETEEKDYRNLDRHVIGIVIESFNNFSSSLTHYDYLV